MVTTFNKKDLVKFGEYLLSEKREERLKKTPTSIPYLLRFRSVYDADLSNWLSEKDEFKNISSVGQMCLDSLNKEEFKSWEKIRSILMRNRIK